MTEFTLDDSRLADVASRYEIETDHDALLALETVILGDGDSGPLLDGGCEIGVDLLADAEGEIDGYRIILHPDEDLSAPWLASSIQRVSYHRDDGRDTAGIIRDFVRVANSLFTWNQGRGQAIASQDRTTLILAADRVDAALEPVSGDSELELAASMLAVLVHVALGNRPEVPGRALEPGETGGLADLADYLDEGADEHDAGGAVDLPGRARLVAAKLREMPGQQGRRHHDGAAATTSPGGMIPRAGKALTTTTGPGPAPLTADHAKALGLLLDAASRGGHVSYRPEGGDLIEGDATGPLTADGAEARSNADVRQCFIGIESWYRGERTLTGMWPVSVMVDAYQADRLDIGTDLYEEQ